MRGRKGDALSPSSPMGQASDQPPRGSLDAGSGGGARTPFDAAMAAGGGSRGGGTGSGIMSPVSPPPGTPVTPPSGAGGGSGGGRSFVLPSGGDEGTASPPKAVRWSDQERDNLHVGLPDSRASSADSLHRTFDSAIDQHQAPPAASGFHVVLTAGGKLEAVSSSARWEDVVGYSRAVKRGPFIYVSGTSAVDQASGRVLYKRDPYRQTRLAFSIIDRALETVGATMEDVVRTRLFVRNLRRDGEHISRAHGEVLGHVKPASTMVEVSQAVHEDILVLIEVDAIKDL